MTGPAWTSLLSGLPYPAVPSWGVYLLLRLSLELSPCVSPFRTVSCCVSVWDRLLLCLCLGPSPAVFVSGLLAVLVSAIAVPLPGTVSCCTVSYTLPFTYRLPEYCFLPSSRPRQYPAVPISSPTVSPSRSVPCCSSLVSRCGSVWGGLVPSRS